VSKKGADRGIDGLILFYDRAEFNHPVSKLRKILVQVKGGGTGPADIAKLKSDLARDDAPMGVFITLRDPTPEMKREAALAGDYAYSDTKVFPKVQIFSIRDQFLGKTVDLPSSTVNPFNQAEVKADQRHLFPLGVA
jgi:site-specific DNA-methyltransferase (adenine-specific)